MQGILEGIRVLESGNYLMGPLAAALLGDLGAEVIKIEEPGRGDRFREVVTDLGYPTALPGDRRVAVERLNRNKKSITLDLKKEAGRKIFYQLVGRSDVYITNLLAKTVSRLSVDYNMLVQHNPKLIYGMASGWGTKGPDSHVPAHDLAGLAKSGLLIFSREENIPSNVSTFGLADEIGGIMLSYGVITALLARERTGIGQCVDISQLGSLISLIGHSLWYHMMTHQLHTLVRSEATNPLWNYYRCKDNRCIVITAPQEKHWPLFCEALGLTGIVNDARFATSEQRHLHHKELISILDTTFVNKTGEEWRNLLQESDIPFSLAQGIDELQFDPQILENEYLMPFEHPVLGKVLLPGVGGNIKYSKTPASVRECAPQLGQHTEEVLIDVLGYSWDEITKLRDEKVI